MAEPALALDTPVRQEFARLDPSIERVVVILVRPSRYDDEGFPWRFWRLVLPSNSLAALKTLVADALSRVVPPHIPAEIHMLEDCIGRHARKLRRLFRRIPKRGTKLIVGFVGVQTAEMPRCSDLIHQWQTRGATCMIGGPHVSAHISTMLDGIADRQRPDVPCPHTMPPEIQELMDKGVVVFHGEAEEQLHHVIADILAGTQRELYRGGMPDLQHAPLPDYDEDYFKGGFVGFINTFDTGRGCPFVCNFCAAINSQGRTMRHRSPTGIVARVKAMCEQVGRAIFFFVDDNFARNPRWEEVLDGLIGLRQAGYRIDFVIEADMASDKIRGFLDKLKQAGCFQIFLGVESMNQDNLAAAHKKQNRVGRFEGFFNECHQRNIIVHAGYIIGFVYDTTETVARDVERLFEAGVDLPSFFILMPLHGSEDHVRAYCAGVPMDTDLSRYDSFHVVTDHPRMTREEWFAAYEKAWRQFYRVENMIKALRRFSLHKRRLDLMRLYFWYRWSFTVERTHPMIAGFYRFRPFRDRRPGAAPLPFWRFCAQETWRHIRYVGLLLAEFYRFQHVVFESEFAPALARKHEQWSGRIQSVGDWFRLTFGKAMSRRWLNDFWKTYANNRWHLFWNPRTLRWHVLMVPCMVSEVVYTVRFAAMLPRLARHAALSRSSQ